MRGIGTAWDFLQVMNESWSNPPVLIFTGGHRDPAEKHAAGG